MDEFGEAVVGNVGELDAYPAFDADVGGLEVGFGGFGDHGLLDAEGDGDPDGGVSVAVVVVGDHDEDAFVDKEGGLAVGELFGGAGVVEG